MHGEYNNDGIEGRQMIRTSDKILKQAVDTIVQEVDPEQVYIFGSEARGEAEPDSDIDLLIVEKESVQAGENRLRRMGRLYRALAARDFGRSFDLLLFTEEEFNRWSQSVNHVIGRCSREGRLLYARH